MDSLSTEDRWRRVILALYHLTNTKTRHVNVYELEAQANTGRDFYYVLRDLGRNGEQWLSKDNLIVRITSLGTNKAQEIINMQIAQKMRIVLGKIYEMGGPSHMEPVNFELLQRELAMDLRELSNIIEEFDRRRWTGTCNDESVCLSPLGVHDYESPSKPRSGGDTYNTTFHGPVQGGVQIGGAHNTQSNVYNNNPKVDEAANAIIQLLKSSGISELVKEDLINDAERLKGLGAKERTPEVAERAKKRLEAIEAGLKVAEKGGGLALKAAPHLATLWEALVNWYGQ